MSIILLLTACTAPVRQSDNAALTTLPTNWHTPTEQYKHPANSLIFNNWLAELNDPELLQWVELALANNQGLAATRLAIQAAQFAAQASRAALWPNLDFSAGANREYGTSSDSPNRKVTVKEYDVLLGTQWELDLFGKNQASTQAANLGIQETASLNRAAQLALVGNVAKSWFRLITLQQQLVASQRFLQNLQASEAYIATRVRRGLIDVVELDLAESATRRAQTEVERLQRLLATEQTTLLTLAGVYNKPDALSLPMVTTNLPGIEDNWQLSAPVTTLLQRPDLRSAFIAIERADKQATAAYRDRFPNLFLTADVGRSSLKLSDLNSSLFDVASVSLEALLPIFDAGQRRARQNQRQTEAEIAAANFQEKLLAAYYEVTTAVNNATLLSRQQAAAAQALAAAERADASSAASYQRGLFSVIELLAVQRQVFTLQQELLEVTKDRLLNRINLYLALGGDFISRGETQHDQNHIAKN